MQREGLAAAVYVRLLVEGIPRNFHSISIFFSIGFMGYRPKWYVRLIRTNLAFWLE